MTQGEAKCYLAAPTKMSEVYPTISQLAVLSQINTTAFIKRVLQINCVFLSS